MFALTNIDHWFLDQIRELIEFEAAAGRSNRRTAESTMLEESTFCGKQSSLDFLIIGSHN